MGPYNRKVYPMSTSASTTPGSTRMRKRTAITQDDLDLAIEALKLYASPDGLTPVRYRKGTKLTPAAILRAELGLSMNITSLPRLASVWRIAPPLTVSEAELDDYLNKQREAWLKEIQAGNRVQI